MKKITKRNILLNIIELLLLILFGIILIKVMQTVTINAFLDFVKSISNK